MKKQEGLTLVSLVITIIVMLILAGLSVALGIGNNGILTQAITGNTKTREGKAIEEVTLAWVAVYNEYMDAWALNMTEKAEDYYTVENLNKYIELTGTISNLEYNANGTSTLTYTTETEEVYNMQVDSKGKVSLVQE